MSKLLGSAVIAAALVLGAGAAHAAESDFCRDYARDAVEQFNRADDMHCERLLRDTVVWSGETRHHFDWCREVSRDRANDARDQRRDSLERCRHERDSDRDRDHDRDHDEY